MPRVVELGFPCPSCGTEEGFRAAERWNSWECVVCSVHSTIRDSCMEIIPDSIRERTSLDITMDTQNLGKEPDWAIGNRAFCNFIHRGEIESITL